MSSHVTAVSSGVDTPATSADTPPPLNEWPVKACCGVLLGDWCECLGFAAEAKRMLERPIFWDLRNRKGVA
jgi:hypothetical protein